MAAIQVDRSLLVIVQNAAGLQARGHLPAGATGLPNGLPAFTCPQATGGGAASRRHRHRRSQQSAGGSPEGPPGTTFADDP